MLHIRRKILRDITGSPLKQKAVAFALLLKFLTKDSSVVRHFSVYKIHRLTGMSYRTVRKYLDTLVRMHLAEFRNGDLYIARMASSAKHRNIDISAITYNNIKDTYNQLRDVLFLALQARKDFMKSLLRLRHNPTRGTNIKKVRRLCKKCCGNPDAEYRESGLSYCRIAREIGCCTRTAFKVVKDCIRRKWCTKKNNTEVVFMPGVGYTFVPGYTFTTQNFGFILHPNTYSLSKKWASAITAQFCG